MDTRRAKLTGLEMIGGSVLLFPFLMVFWVVSSIYRAWITQYLWGWFAVPLGLPQLSIPHFIGIFILLGTMRPGVAATLKSEVRVSLKQQLLAGLLGPALALLCGWLVHWYMT